MLPVGFPEKIFLKPSSMTDEECGDLDVYKGNDVNGNPIIISKWNPSYEDIQSINKGDGIYLMILGQGMPPVSIFTENPFNNTKI